MKGSKKNGSGQGDPDYPWYFHLAWIIPIVISLVGVLLALDKFAGN